MQGLGALTAAAGLEAVRALPPAAQTEAIRGIAATGAAVGRADSAVRSWARDNPNTAEVAKAAANVGSAAFGAIKGINSAGKTTANSSKSINAASPNLGMSNTGAQSANAQTALSKKLSGLEKAQNNVEKIRTLSDGRVRYYTEEKVARTSGVTRSASFVTEYNPRTGQTKQWMESYDHRGKVIRVHPKSINGQSINSPHYPPTGKELNR